MSNSELPPLVPPTDDYLLVDVLPDDYLLVNVLPATPPLPGEAFGQQSPVEKSKLHLDVPGPTRKSKLQDDVAIPRSPSTFTLNKLWDPEGQFQVQFQVTDPEGNLQVLDPEPDPDQDPDLDPDPIQLPPRKSSLQRLSRNLSKSVSDLYTAAKNLDIASVLARTSAPRPHSTADRIVSSPMPTIGPVPVPSPDRKQKKLTKSASAIFLRSSVSSASSNAPGDLRPPSSDGLPASGLLSVGNGHRPVSTGSLSPAGGDLDGAVSDRGRLRNRMSFMPRSRAVSQEKPEAPPAWVLGGPNVVAYDLEALHCGGQVLELWDDAADVSVHLFPGSPASFKVPAAILQSSSKLMTLAFSQAPDVGQLPPVPETPIVEAAEEALGRLNFGLDADEGPYDANLRGSISQFGQARVEGHLYFPMAGLSIDEHSKDGGETDRLLAARNLFAFLLNKPLVASKKFPTAFSVISSIATYLKDMEFFDERSRDFGIVASTEFARLSEQYALQDVRESCTKAVQGVILGERFRNSELYYESFTHLAGNYFLNNTVNTALKDMIPIMTRRRLEREYMDLENRQKAADRCLVDFDLPHIFNGSATSKVTTESKVVRFAAWKVHFNSFRSFVLTYYRDLHGSWPPKTTNRKTNPKLAGLNRLALQTLYEDFSLLYDLLVDRESLTTRSLDVEVLTGEETMTQRELEVIALRKIMSEHDRSSIPTSPPIPFDLPQLPTLTTIDAGHLTRSAKDQHSAETRKLKSFEGTLVMAKAHNMDQGIQAPFLTAFAEFEQKESESKTIRELRDQRFGYWLFLYAILQSLPILVVDAPKLRFTGGVDYFLCKPPVGALPWLEVDKHYQYEPADNTSEGIYSRSHCWVVGAKLKRDLELKNAIASSPYASYHNSPYLPPMDDYPAVEHDWNLQQNYDQHGWQRDWQNDNDSNFAPAAAHPPRLDSMASQGSAARMQASRPVSSRSSTRSRAASNRSSNHSDGWKPAGHFDPAAAPASDPSPTASNPPGPALGPPGMYPPDSRPASGQFVPREATPPAFPHGGIRPVSSRPGSRQGSRPTSGYYPPGAWPPSRPGSALPFDEAALRNNLPRIDTGGGGGGGGSADGSVNGGGSHHSFQQEFSAGGGGGARGAARARVRRLSASKGTNTFDDILQSIEKGKGGKKGAVPPGGLAVEKGKGEKKVSVSGGWGRKSFFGGGSG